MLPCAFVCSVFLGMTLSRQQQPLAGVSPSQTTLTDPNFWRNEVIE